MASCVVGASEEQKSKSPLVERMLEVRQMLVPRAQPLEYVLNLISLGYLGQVLRMPAKRRPRYVVFFDAGSGLRIVRGGQ